MCIKLSPLLTLIDPGKTGLRYERKFFTRSIGLQQLELWIRTHKKCFSISYPDRTVNNIYFDTADLELFRIGVEGVARRSKVRLRWYGHENYNQVEAFIELKRKRGYVGDKLRWVVAENSGLGRGAKDIALSNLVNQHFEHYWAHLDVVGPLFPVLENRYQRRYFESRDKAIRLTLDSALSYRLTKKYENQRDRYVTEPGVVLEVKYPPSVESEAEEFTSKLPVRMSKISKYLHGLEMLHSNWLINH